MLAYLLFSFYLFCGTILLHLFIRRRIFPFSVYHTSFIILIKVFLGCLYGWVFLRFYGGDDTWNYFNESKVATDLLLNKPGVFFKEFSPAYSYEISNGSFWNALVFYIAHFEKWFMVKGLGILNLFSGKNYYIDVLWFEFMTLPGPLLLFKLFARQFPDRIGLNYLLIFFIPSVIFWCSGIRAEGLLFLAISLMLYFGDAYISRRGIRNLTGITAGLILFLLIRYQYLVLFLPAYIAYLISLRNNENTGKYFSRIFLVLGIAFIASLFLPADFQLSRPVQESQQKFFSLQAKTRYSLDSLKPGLLNWVKVFPQAFANSILRPYPWEGKSLLQSLSAIDVLIIIFGIMYFFLSPGRKKQISHPVYWMFLFYGVSQIILIGYAVPFPGAIVRYRIIPFFMLVLFFYAGNPLLQRKIKKAIFKLH